MSDCDVLTVGVRCTQQDAQIRNKHHTNSQLHCNSSFENEQDVFINNACIHCSGRFLSECVIPALSLQISDDNDDEPGRDTQNAHDLLSSEDQAIDDNVP